MIDKGQWWQFCQDTGVTPLLFTRSAMDTLMCNRHLIRSTFYIYAFSRRFYPKRLTVHSGYTFFCQYVCSLGIEPTTFALLTQCSTTEPREQL